MPDWHGLGLYAAPGEIVTITALGQNGPASNAVGAFPSWPKTDPEAIARGKQVYGANCAYCHGEDARGGVPTCMSWHCARSRQGQALRLAAESGQP